MPLIHTIQPAADTKIGIWHITEEEAFFREKVSIEPQIHHPHKRLQHLAARYLLVALSPGFPVQDICIKKSRKPYLPSSDWHFSLSHCRDWAAAILSNRHAVGIDVETISNKVERVAHKFLEPGELAFLDLQQLHLHLTLCWCAKEAIYKWNGEGGIDFRGNMRLEPFALLKAGHINARFIKAGQTWPLHLQYVRYNLFCVVWVAEQS